MRRLFLNLLLVLFPFIIYCCVPFVVLLAAGEYKSYERFTEIHNERRDAFLGMAYSGPHPYMRLQTVIRRKPEIITLGNSRMLPYRNFFFKDSNRFYNAGISVSKLKQYKYFLQQIPDAAKPKVILMSIDHFYFNRNWDDLAIDDFSDEYKEKFSASNYVLANMSRIWDDIKARKFSVGDLFYATDTYIGLTARVKKQGFRYDGSHYYGSEIPKGYDTVGRFAESFRHIEEGRKRFVYADTTNPAAFAALEELLAYCRQHDIYVAGFLPTYAHAVYRKMQEKGKFHYMDGLYEKIRPIFHKYGYNFFDFTDIYYLGASDMETIDGYHISEVAALRLLIKVAEQDSVIRQYVDLEQLRYALQHAYSPYAVYKDN